MKLIKAPVSELPVDLSRANLIAAIGSFLQSVGKVDETEITDITHIDLTSDPVKITLKLKKEVDRLLL